MTDPILAFAAVMLMIAAVVIRLSTLNLFDD